MSRAIRKMLDKELISRNQFEQAAMLKAKSGNTLGFHLVEIGALTEETIVEFMLEHFSSPYYSRERLLGIENDVLSIVPNNLALQYRLLPVEIRGRNLVVGITDPTRTHAIEELAFHTGLEIVTVVLTETDMSFALENYFSERSKKEGTPSADDLSESEAYQLNKPTLMPEKDRSKDAWSSSDKPAIAVRPAINVISMPPPAPPRKAESIAAKNKDDPAERRLTEGEILSKIFKAGARDDVIDLSLQYMLQFSDRAAFFVVRKSAIRGYEIKGELTSQSAIRSYWVPLISESTLRQVIRERRIHLGPLGRTAADAILSASLGGRPSRILAIPIEIGHRVIGLLYADRLHVGMPPWNRLERLAEVMGDNLRRILMEKTTASNAIG